MSYDFADRLIELRRAKGMSQEELASALGLSRQAVSKWERAESAPDIGNLVALSELYGVSLDDLVRGQASAPDAAEEAAESEAGAEDETVVEIAVEESPIEEASIEDVTEATASEDANASSAEGTPTPTPTPAPAPTPTPASMPTSQAVAQHRTSKAWRLFPYPLLCVIIFLFLGFFCGLWHPAWIIFLTIPFYYWVVNLILHDPAYMAAHDPNAATGAPTSIPNATVNVTANTGFASRATEAVAGEAPHDAEGARHD